MFTKNCESIRLMFEYQTTGTHFSIFFCFEVLLVNARKGLRVRRGTWAGPQPVSHSSVGRALVFGAAVVVIKRLRVIRVEPSVRR